MKKESARSLRLTSEAITALKTLGADNPECSQGDLASQALIEKASKAPLAPVIRLGVLDHQQVAILQCEAAIAERRLRDLKQMILRLRPQDKSQAEKLSTILKSIDVALEEERKLRLSLANAARLGKELTPDDRVRAKALRDKAQQDLENSNDEEVRRCHELAIRLYEAFLLQ